jgi:tRNA threonylcarbamoyladenosine biosynthesis protein TsaE
MKKLSINTLKDLDATAGQFVSLTGGFSHIALYGAMGSGKTTLIKAIVEKLGSEDNVTSPTFTIVNEYQTGKGRTIYHFDFYRIKKVEEIFDFGFEEYIESGEICLMEWPELIEDFLPEDVLKVYIEVKEDNCRIISIPSLD